MWGVARALPFFVVRRKAPDLGSEEPANVQLEQLESRCLQDALGRELHADKTETSAK